MYQITITKQREYTTEEQEAIKENRKRDYWYSNNPPLMIDTTVQVLSTTIDEEQFKAMQKSILETFK